MNSTSGSKAPVAHPLRILAVIVLYKTNPADSPSFISLSESARQLPPGRIQLEIYLHDNSPTLQTPDTNLHARYETAPHNPGLACAYNRAIEIANTEQFEWLITLDQDTTLPTNYLARMADHLRSIEPDQDIAAVVPQVVDNGKVLSPFRFAGRALPTWFRRGYTGCRIGVYAVNSASIFRVSSLNAVGGYDPKFPLDVSDINLFHRLYMARYRVLIDADLVIGHSFSLFNKGERMNLERYGSMLLDECAFWDINMGSLARGERFLRLMWRVCKDVRSGHHSGFQRATVLELFRRLFTRRSVRIRKWKSWSESRELHPRAARHLKE